MFEKVNPSHPDKISDRIAGAIVDLGYKKQNDPKIAVEILMGHRECNVIIESSVNYKKAEIEKIIRRIEPNVKVFNVLLTKQDTHLAKNQEKSLKCGDNGVFTGCPITNEQKELTLLSKAIYEKWNFDGKYIYDEKSDTLIVCQSNAKNKDLRKFLKNKSKNIKINPLGEWTGGINVDSGATNRKLGSDMGDAVTGGGLHGKDLSKADVSVNIICHILAQKRKMKVTAFCAIGDEKVNFHYEDGSSEEIPYWYIIRGAKNYINKLGGFERFAEWGLIGNN